jgi:hypothetical protein
LAFFPNCGAERIPGANFCNRCGYDFQTNTPRVARLGPDERQKGLNDMKLSFIFYMVGGGLALIPVVGSLGALPVLVGLIFFIVGWRALGRATLAESPRYKSTGNWFIYTIVILIVGSAIGATVIAFSLIGSFIVQSPPPNPQALFQGPFFRSFFTDIFAMSAAFSAVWLLPWYKASSSLAKLSVEISQPRLKTSGRLFFLSAVVGIVVQLVLAASFYRGLVSINALATGSGIRPSYVWYYPPYIGAGYVNYYLITLIQSVILVVAAFEGYKAVKGPAQ